VAGLIKKIAIFLKKKWDFLKFKSDVFNLNQIMIYIRIFQHFLGYCSYNWLHGH